MLVSGLQPSQWNTLSLPIAAFAQAHTFNRIAIRSAGTAGGAFWLDDVLLDLR